MNNERQFETDIESLMTGELGWTKGTDKSYVKWRKYALDLERLIDFVKATQQNVWQAFVHSCGGLDVYATFYRKFEDAVGQKGLVRVLRDGFHANGKLFKVLAPKPENGLNDTMGAAYEKNICQFIRQWHYSEKDPAKSVDIVLQVKGRCKGCHHERYLCRPSWKAVVVTNAFVFFSHFAGMDGDRPILVRTGNEERGSGERAKASAGGSVASGTWGLDKGGRCLLHKVVCFVGRLR